jgi:hypothetical protein
MKVIYKDSISATEEHNTREYTIHMRLGNIVLCQLYHPWGCKKLDLENIPFSCSRNWKRCGCAIICCHSLQDHPCHMYHSQLNCFSFIIGFLSAIMVNHNYVKCIAVLHVCTLLQLGFCNRTTVKAFTGSDGEACNNVLGKIGKWGPLRKKQMYKAF